MEAEVETNGNKGQIYGLLAQILKDVGPISKGRKNEEQNYRFRGIDDVYAAVHPLFAQYGVFTVPRILSEQTTERTTARGTVLRFVNVTMAYDFFAPDGSSVTAEMIGEAMDAGDKASNKAMSAAHKYALIQTLCIPCGLPDTEEQNHEVTGEAKPISKSGGTASEVCVKCGGPMWDNREGKRNPKAPDYKCKDKSCDGAVWIKKTEGFGTDSVLRDELFNQAEKLLGGWDAEKRKEALGRLVLLSTEEMGKKVNELAENARKRSAVKQLDGGTQMGHLEDERQKMLAEVVNGATSETINSYIDEHFKGKKLERLSLDALTQMYDDLIENVPF